MCPLVGQIACRDGDGGVHTGVPGLDGIGGRTAPKGGLGHVGDVKCVWGLVVFTREVNGLEIVVNRLARRGELTFARGSLAQEQDHHDEDVLGAVVVKGGGLEPRGRAE